MNGRDVAVRLLCAFSLSGVACSGRSLNGAEGFSCQMDADCDANTWCIEKLCVPRVDAGAKPGPFNTGVPHGVQLVVSGGLNLVDDGGVIEGLDVQGCVKVRANGVTLRKSRIRCDGLSVIEVTGTDALLEDLEIDGLGNDQAVGVLGSATVRRTNIHHVGRGAQVTDASLFENCFFHDLLGTQPFGILTDGAPTVIARGSNVEAPAGVGYAVWGDDVFAPLQGMLVERNWLSGGRATVQMAATRGSGNAVNNNRLGRNFGTTALELGSNVTQHGNVYDDNNEALPP